MSISYHFVQWNKQKKQYDWMIVFGMLFYMILFTGLTFVFNSQTTIETLLIRCFGSLALIMIHVILIIGPLCRINSKFLPLLYNRRHLGVSMFMAAFIHGGFSIFQFHALGNTNPIYSIFTSNTDYGSLTNFPFQVLGFFALIILFTMASTSHDFFLKNLTPTIWKYLHMMVYVAYALILFHVFLGAFQQETSIYTTAFLSLGFLTVATLHVTAGITEKRRQAKTHELDTDGWLQVCSTDEIANNRAKLFTANKEKIAIYKYDGKLSAIHNVCKHQGGPLSEGKVIDGCVTCPWHGYQYFPQNGQSPPPFTEKVATYRLKLVNEIIYVNPDPLPEGTEVKPIYLRS